MKKSIFVFNDGTGQHFDSESQSNVAKLFSALPGDLVLGTNADLYKVDHSKNYHALYYRGIGTEDLRHKDESKAKLSFWQKIVAKISKTAQETAELVLGHTIKDRVERTLEGIEKLWQEGDEIFLIGFSRGAASVRIAATELVKTLPNFNVKYMLIFDTVYSVQTEVQIRQNMKIERFTDTMVNDKIFRCDHLIAGDEMRDMFPITEVSKRKGVRQILFAGSHSDVGGGNPSSALSDISLKFAINEFVEMSVEFDNKNVTKLNIHPDAKAAIEWDRFNGTGQKHFPRCLKKMDFLIHQSVFERANADQSISIALAQLSKFKTQSKLELVEVDSVQANFIFQTEKNASFTNDNLSL